MMREEFELLIGEEVGADFYNTIEFVYTWYPTISETDGKQQIADIFKAGGIAVINDMVPRAMKNKEFEEKKAKLLSELEKVNKNQKELKTAPEFQELE